MSSSSGDDEISAITAFLCERDPSIFRRAEERTIEVIDPREALVLASVVSDGFFLRRPAGEVEAYPIHLQRGLVSRWIIDLKNEYEELFDASKKFVKFFSHWIPETGYSGKGAEYRTNSRLNDMYQALAVEIEKSGRSLSEVLFIPMRGYARGRQLGESIYHYIAGRIFTDMGYIVFDEYAPTFMTGTARTPDLSVFRTPEIAEIMKLLRAKGIISRGAFIQELQFHGVFGKQEQAVVSSSKELTDAESVAIEVKRTETEYSVTKGSRQLQDYLTEAYGFYDEGYLAGPFISGPGTVSLDLNGKLLFERPAPSTSAAVTDYWKESKAEQLKDVRVNIIFQLLKGSGLAAMVEASGGREKVRTYQELVSALEDMDIQDALRYV